MTRRAIRMTVNGHAAEAFVDPRRTLADVLREDLELTGTHLGCEHGVCGACTVLLDGGKVAEARIAFSGMAQTPLRVPKAEAALIGQAPSAEVWAAAVADGVAGLEPPSDLHGTSEYRRHLVGVLLARALREAHDRAEGGA